MARRGRPKGGDSAETRIRILNAAREEFATRGFDGASVATIAAKASLAPSAVYHYFGGKSSLYEEVFEVTSEAVWSVLAIQFSGSATLLEAVDDLVSNTDKISEQKPYFNHFLALVPMEATLHPEFSYMFDRRSKRQDETFGAMAELGLITGELAGFSQDTATEMLRSLFMGWFVESHFLGGLRPGSRESMITLIRLLGERSSM